MEYLKDSAFINFQSKGITIILSFARKLYGLLFVSRSLYSRQNNSQRRIDRKDPLRFYRGRVKVVSLYSAIHLHRVVALRARFTPRRNNPRRRKRRAEDPRGYSRSRQHENETRLLIIPLIIARSTLRSSFPRDGNNLRGRIAGKIVRETRSRRRRKSGSPSFEEHCSSPCDTANRADLRRIIE